MEVYSYAYRKATNQSRLLIFQYQKGLTGAGLSEACLKDIISLSMSLLPGFDHTLPHQAALLSSDNIVTVEWF
jgi:hypothetical protein